MALLLIHANEVVSADRLIDGLWGSQPPTTASKALQGYVSQLRKTLGRGVLVTEPTGYVLRVDSDRIDIRRFESLVDEAASLEPAGALGKLEEALALRIGRPLADFAYDDFARAEIMRMEELELAALESKIDAELELGRHESVIGELEALVSRYPLREGLRAQLMTALYRSGRQADALQAYSDARRFYTEELGLEPGDELRRLQRSILTRDPGLAARAAPEAPTGRKRWHLAAAAALLLVIVGVVAGVLIALNGGGGVAVRANSVAAIDPKTNRVVADVRVGSQPSAVTVGGGSVWVANADDGTVSRVDPKTRRVVATIGVGGDPSDLAYGYGAVWVAGGNAGTLARIDPRANTVVKTLSFGPSGGIVVEPVFSVATGAGGVWVVRGNRVLRIDPVLNRVAAAIPVLGPGDLTAGPGTVWVAAAQDKLKRIDASANRVTASTPLPSGAISPEYSDNELWMIVLLGAGNVWRLDPNTLVVSGTTSTSHGTLAIAVGPRAVWASNVTGALWRINRADVAPVDKIVLRGHPSDVAVGAGAVWVTLAQVS